MMILVIALLSGRISGAAPVDAGRIEFFEARIRPVLIEQCYKCHNSVDVNEGGLALDHRAALMRGGDSGPAIVPGRADESLLIQAIRHEDDDLRMPEDGAKLEQDVVADFVTWINLGAADPRDKAPSAEQLAKATSWEATRARRMQWWSFQPLAKPEIPAVGRDEESDHPVDRFILARLEAAGLQVAEPAERRTLIRRLTFALTGLPPTAEAINEFIHDDSPNAYETLVDSLLRSEHFGERWARHWMDWIRYAETHGSEGDPAIPHAWRYRDYLIRALNADIPYDQLIREHVAGDLLANPRINEPLAINESVLGIAQYRFVQHGFAPTDALDEQVRFTDNQIDVLSKAFMGLTVSCARCHNHKFDPISQTDFYAWYGILASCRPALVTIDTPDRLATNKKELAALKVEIRRQLSTDWLGTIDQFASNLLKPEGDSWTQAIKQAAEDNKHPLHAWSRLQNAQGPEFLSTWNTLADDWKASVKNLAAHRNRTYSARWNLAGDDYHRWYSHGVGLGQTPSPPGEFHIPSDGDQIIGGIFPAGVYSHLLSDKHNAVLMSPRFMFDMKDIYVRVIGAGGAKTRYVVQNYPRNGTVYPIHTLGEGKFKWVRWDATYWNGDQGYLEISTAADQPVVVDTGAVRSWFGITEAVFVSEEQAARGDVPRDEAAEFVTPLFTAALDKTPTSRQDVAQLYQTALRECVRAWASGSMSDEQARFLNSFVRSGLLSSRISQLPKLSDVVRDYRRLENDVPIPTRAPGIVEADSFDQPLFIRGDHKKPGERVARRFLESIDAQPYQTIQSGRLELANDLAGADNPLTARVAVNRIWHHLFGRGIVATTDNFGRLGEEPTHPQLLDYLAVRFVEEGWSVKRMIRFLVTSNTFQMDSHAPEGAGQIDPKNQWLSHFRVRRLEAEAIRDAILSVSGQLDPAMYGPGTSGGSRRRSIYVNVRRNSLDPFLSVFDAPEPHTTRGSRDATNVPAQSLALLNDPFVIGQAKAWGEALLKDSSLSDEGQRIERMFPSAFGREATTGEREDAARFLAELTRKSEQIRHEVAQLESALDRGVERAAAMIGPIRDRLRDEINSSGAEVPAALAPIACWEFDEDLRDCVGILHGTAHGNAHIDGGTLVVDGSSHVETASLDRDLREKTLEASVMLDNLQQRGGGVIGIQTIGGQVFDSIVFGERDPKQWLPGSNNFLRTQPLSGQPESEAESQPVHIAMVYHADGRIAAYRNGKPYGKAYKSNGPVTFASGKAVILFGLRHSPAGGNRRLAGRIARAQLFDRALTAEEVAALSRGDRHYFSEEKIVAQMSKDDRDEYSRLQSDIERLRNQLKRFEMSRDYGTDPSRIWQDLAHSLFNFKEFIYVK